MHNAETISKILYDYNEFNKEELIVLINDLPIKLVRWLATFHPDNRTRKMLLRMSNVEIGEGTVININFIISDDYKKLLKIGSRVAISPGVTIICCSAPNNSDLNNNYYVKENLILEKEVVIEDDVWIGTNAVILPGTTIGQSSVIGAGSVVSKNVEPFSVYAGVPAQKIRSIKE